MNVENIPGEEWRDIPSAPNYMVSNLGRVYTKKNHRTLSLRRTSKGYCFVRISCAGDKKARKVHRLVAEAFLPPAQPDRPHINHKDLVKDNNHVDNLEWCSPKENNAHYLSSPNKGPRAILVFTGVNQDTGEVARLEGYSAFSASPFRYHTIRSGNLRQPEGYLCKHGFLWTSIKTQRTR